MNMWYVSYSLDTGKYSWFDGDMMTSPNANIFRVTVHLSGEFTGHR